ncbi:glycosyltransferase family 39 protein [bacterium]|nr:glycosyltransferase family 39 protein [bacterium]
MSRNDRRWSGRDGAAAWPRAGGGSVMWWVVALTVAAAVLRFYRIGAQSFWVDELWTVKAAAVGDTLSAAAVFTNVQGPAHAVLVHLVSAVSRSEGGLRAISALFGTATVPLVYLLGAATVDRKTGVMAALLAAVSPFLIWYSQELRNYAMLIFFAAAATLAVWHIVSSRAGPWLGYGAAIALAGLSNLSAVFLAVAHWVFALPRARSDRRFLAQWLITFAIVLVFLAPWVWGVTQWVEADRVGERITTPVTDGDQELLRGETTFTPMAIPYSFYVMIYGYSVGPSNAELHTARPLVAFGHHKTTVLPALALLTVAGLMGIVVFWRDRLRFRLLAGTVIVPIAAVTLLAVLNIKVFNPRYVAVMTPLVLVVVAAGVMRLPRVGMWVVGTGIVVISLMGVANYFWNPTYWREDVRSAARYIEEREQDGDVVLVPVVTDVFDHYHQGLSERFLLYPGQCMSDEEVAARVDDGTGGHKRVWFVQSRLWHADPDGRIASHLDLRHELMQSACFPGVTVDLYQLEGGSPDPPEPEERG